MDKPVLHYPTKVKTLPKSKLPSHVAIFNKLWKEHNAFIDVITKFPSEVDLDTLPAPTPVPSKSPAPIQVPAPNVTNDTALTPAVETDDVEYPLQEEPSESISTRLRKRPNPESNVNADYGRIEVPIRHLPVGQAQDLTDANIIFLQHALALDLPMKVQSFNPKSGLSRKRYERYKSALTLKDFKPQGLISKMIMSVVF